MLPENAWVARARREHTTFVVLDAAVPVARLVPTTSCCTGAVLARALADQPLELRDRIVRPAPRHERDAEVEQALAPHEVDLPLHIARKRGHVAEVDQLLQRVGGLLAIAEHRSWLPPILKAIARSGEGVPELVDAIDQHQAHVRSSGHADGERRALAEAQILSLVRAALYREALAAARADGAIDALVTEVAARQRDPRSAATSLVDAVRDRWAVR